MYLWLCSSALKEHLCLYSKSENKPSTPGIKKTRHQEPTCSKSTVRRSLSDTTCPTTRLCTARELWLHATAAEIPGSKQSHLPRQWHPKCHSAHLATQSQRHDAVLTQDCVELLFLSLRFASGGTQTVLIGDSLRPPLSQDFWGH